MLTADEIEKVAREWCRLSEVDPDQFQPAPPHMQGRIATMEQRMIPAWQIIAGHVVRHDLMREAFRVLEPKVIV